MDEHRKAGRKKFFVDAVLETDKGHYVVQSKNLSEAGIFLTMRRALPVGTVLKIALGNPPRLPMIRLSGIIKRHYEENGVGIAFTDISASDLEAIRGFIAHPVNMAQEQS